MSYACNHSTGEQDTNNSCGSLANHPSLLGQYQASKGLLSQKKEMWGAAGKQLNSSSEYSHACSLAKTCTYIHKEMHFKTTLRYT